MITMLREPTVDRNRLIWELSRTFPIAELAAQLQLSKRTVARIVAHFNRWGEFS